jgi:hypothetical protein
MTTDNDRRMRKQLVLARIAADRLEWHGDLNDLMLAANPRSIWPSMVRAAFGPGWLSNLVGGGGPRTAGHTVPPQGLGSHLLDGLTMLRRYPVLLTMAGSAVAWLRAQRGAPVAGPAFPGLRAPRRRARRIALLVGVGAAVAGSTWFLVDRWRRARAR